MALGINSYYSKQKLVSLHENIKVLRHPDHAKAGVLFWAHHEKIVCIDQTYAFIGGIDLCYGRWDDHKHRLTDLGSICPQLMSTPAPSYRASTVAESSILTLMNQSKDILAATTVGMLSGKEGDSVAYIKRSVGVVQGEGEDKVIEITETKLVKGGKETDGEDSKDEEKVENESADLSLARIDNNIPGSQLIHETTRIIQGSQDDQVIHELITITKSPTDNDIEMTNYNRRLSENIQDIRKMVPGSPESIRMSKTLRETAGELRKSAGNLNKMAGAVEGLAENLQAQEASAQLISSEIVHVANTAPTPCENLPPVTPAVRKQLLKSPNSTKKIDTEEVAENTKKDTPEMERKNMLGKFKDNVRSKSRDIMSRMASTIQMDPPSPEIEEKPEVEEEIEKEVEEEEIGLDGQAKLWIGKDYTNFILQDFIELDSPFNDMVDRTTTPRMPWHDIATVVVGHTARDAARHFIQRWNAVKLEKARENLSYPYIMPKSYIDMRIDENFFPKHKMSMSRVTSQMLRSVSQWSCGYIEADNCEQSIHEAYVQTITKAQHYIYIENQFFISTTYQDQNVKNQITEVLSKRILRAHRLAYFLYYLTF